MRATSSDGTSAAAGTPLDAAILSPERVIRGKIEVDWDKDGFSQSQYFGSVPSFDDTFQGASIDPRWTLSGAGAAFDSTNHQLVLPSLLGTQTGTGPQVTTGGTSATWNQYFDMAGATLRFKFTLPTFAATTRGFDIYIVDRDTGDYWYFRNDANGTYMQTYNASTASPQSKFATWGSVNSGKLAKQIDLYFAGDYSPSPSSTNRLTTITYTDLTTYTALGFSSQFPVPPPRLNNCKIVMTSYFVTSGTSANVTVQEVKYQGAANNDDMTRQADQLEIDRSLQGVLPSEVALVEGSATAQTTTDFVTGETLDERKTAAWKMSPFNQNSPLYSSPVLGVPVKASIEIETPAGPKRFQKMVGTVQSLDVNVSSGAAPMTAFDNRYKLAGQVQLPLIDGDIYGLNATALVDYALASNGVNWGPPIMPGAQLWIPMHGSAYPMISGGNGATRGKLLLNGVGAHNTAPYTRWDQAWNALPPKAPFFTFGPFSGVKALMLGADALAGTYGSGVTWAKFFTYLTPAATANNDMFSQTNSRGTVGVWIKGDAITGLPEDIFRMHLEGPVIGSVQTGLELYIDNTRKIGFKFAGPGTGFISVASSQSLPTDGNWHYVGFSWDGTASGGTVLSMNACLDSTTGGGYNSTAGQWTLSKMPVHDTWNPNCYYWSNLPVAEIQAYPWNSLQVDSGYTNASKYIQTAVLDYSTLELHSNTDSSVREAWGLVNEIAAAEFAASYFDEDGIYRYKIRSRVSTDTASNTVQKTIGGKTTLTDLKLSSGIDKVRNTVNLTVTPAQIQRNVVVATSTDTFALPAGKVTNITLPLSNPVAGLQLIQVGSLLPYTPVLPDNAFLWPNNADSWGPIHGMVCVRSATSGGSILGIPYPQVVSMTANSVTIAFSNPYHNTIYIVNDGTTAGFTYGGGSQFANGTAAMQYWGNPSIMLVGDVLLHGAETIVSCSNSFSIATFGQQSMDLNANQWVQDIPTATGVTSAAAGTLAFPVPNVSASAIGDPRLQLGDRIKLQAGDFDGIQDNPVLNQEFWLEGITDHLGPDSGYEQDLDLRIATKKLKWATAKTDTQYGFFDQNLTNKWDRYSWG